MIGPLVCVMCHLGEETIRHLYQGCDWVRAVWEKGGVLFGKVCLGKGVIHETIEQGLSKCHLKQDMGITLGICGLGDLEGKKRLGLRWKEMITRGGLAHDPLQHQREVGSDQVGFLRSPSKREGDNNFEKLEDFQHPWVYWKHRRRSKS